MFGQRLYFSISEKGVISVPHVTLLLIEPDICHALS